MLLFIYIQSWGWHHQQEKEENTTSRAIFTRGSLNKGSDVLYEMCWLGKQCQLFAGFETAVQFGPVKLNEEHL